MVLHHQSVRGERWDSLGNPERAYRHRLELVAHDIAARIAAPLRSAWRSAWRPRSALSGAAVNPEGAPRSPAANCITIGMVATASTIGAAALAQARAIAASTAKRRHRRLQFDPGLPHPKPELVREALDSVAAASTASKASRTRSHWEDHPEAIS